MDQVLEYFDKEWEIYEIFSNKMLYIGEEPKESDIETHTKHSLVGQVSHSCEGN